MSKFIQDSQGAVESRYQVQSPWNKFWSTKEIQLKSIVKVESYSLCPVTIVEVDICCHYFQSS